MLSAHNSLVPGQHAMFQPRLPVNFIERPEGAAGCVAIHPT
jgi:hypothetical protein